MRLAWIGLVCLLSTGLGCAGIDVPLPEETGGEEVAITYELWPAEGDQMEAVSGPLSAASGTTMQCGDSDILRYDPKLRTAARGTSRTEAAAACAERLEDHVASTVTCDTSACIEPATCEAYARGISEGTSCQEEEADDGTTRWRCRCWLQTARAGCTDCDLPEETPVEEEEEEEADPGDEVNPAEDDPADDSKPVDEVKPSTDGDDTSEPKPTATKTDSDESFAASSSDDSADDSADNSVDDSVEDSAETKKKAE